VSAGDLQARVGGFFRVWIPVSAVGFTIAGFVLGGIGEAIFMTCLGVAGGLLAYYVIRKS
jgi:hypothetical protein